MNSSNKQLKTIRDVPIRGKRVLVRVDFNVGMENGNIRSDARIRAALPTIAYLREQECSVILCSHLGRPKEGQFDPKFSLAPVAERLKELTGCPVHLVGDGLDKPPELSKDFIVLLENVRFVEGEQANDPQLAQSYAKLCDVFVLDAFGSAHRAHASTLGVASCARQAVAGLLVAAEVEALHKALSHPERPVVAIIGGAKISSKLPVLQSIVGKIDFLIPGGGIANNFIAAQGCAVGASLLEAKLMDETKKLRNSDCQVLIPEDVVVATAIDAQADHRQCAIDQIGSDEMIVDIGTRTIDNYRQALAEARTVIWNGPVGVFEIEAFSHGTRAIGHTIAQQTKTGQTFSIAGGGDTLDALSSFQIDDISYISTGGGAFLEFIENLDLVALEPLYF